jgi:hypothetical protein
MESNKYRRNDMGANYGGTGRMRRLLFRNMTEKYVKCCFVDTRVPCTWENYPKYTPSADKLKLPAERRRDTEAHGYQADNLCGNDWRRVFAEEAARP